MHAALVSGFAAFGLPPGRTVASYFTGLNSIQLALFVALMVSAGLTYYIFIHKDGNISQTFGVILIVVWVTVFADGLKGLQGVLWGLVHLVWAWLTGT